MISALSLARGVHELVDDDPDVYAAVAEGHGLSPAHPAHFGRAPAHLADVHVIALVRPWDDPDRNSNVDERVQFYHSECSECMTDT